ncbi:MAG TPA: 50S ribosomal protein L16 [Herpetosiphonaceae bacterium]
MLMPKRMKYRKMHRGVQKHTRIAGRGTTVAFGDFGLMAVEQAWIDSRQIEAARRAITHYVKRGGKVWIRIFPDKPITQKPAETRMGSGKGAVEYYVAVVKPGRVMFELGGVREDIATAALQRAAQKLPIKCKIIAKETAGEVQHNEGE